ncbi:MAG: heavy metal sensor histidine kinase [Gammaproteobacteria bacterium]|nr:heavy metal sensor histidine kinase [Gammaproteobacteria bacterium]
MFYSLAAFVLLTIITLFLYWETVNILYKADYQFLSNEVESLQYILRNKKIDSNVIKQNIVEFPTQISDSIYRYYTRIYNENNQVIIETPGMSSILPHEIFLKPSFNRNYKKTHRWYSNHHANYLLVQSPVAFENNKIGTILIALDISYQHMMISDRKFLIIALLASMLCSLLLGFTIAHRGMKSLYVLTDTVKTITATSLHQRIDPKSLPKELNKLGIAFNQMLDRIESSFTRLKQFSSDLAHELRIPINNLVGETEITLSRNHTVDEYQQVLISNLEEFHRISQLIENILFLSRAENPQLEIQKNLLKVDEEIAVVCDYYQAMADEKNISISIEGKADLHVNLIMFRRMISNILSNALKYTPSKGWIRFEISTMKNNNVQIMLRDNGIGIPIEHQPKIFDRFYRVDTARSQHSGGIGLGLAIVKSIVDLHQGQVSIDSEPEIGTTICVILPQS